MSSRELDVPGVEHRIERAVPHPSPIIPTLVEVQAKGCDSNREEGQNSEEVSVGDDKNLEGAMDALAARTEESLGIDNGELWIQQLAEQAKIAESNFERLGAVKYMDEAIEYRRQVLSLTPDWNEQRHARLAHLGTALLRRVMHTGQRTDVDEAIKYLNQALLLTPDGHESKLARLQNLAVAYQIRFNNTDELEDLKMAIEHQTQALLLTPNGRPEEPGLFNNLGNSYASRFRRTGDIADLNKAIEYQTQAVLLTADEHPEKPSRLGNLGVSYRSRFGRIGKLADLNRAIEYEAQAVLLTADGHTHKPGLLNNLGVSYESRFRRIGEFTDLVKAIEYQTQAVLLTPDGHAQKPSLLNSLGTSYRSRFERMSELSDLNKAIEYQTQAVLLTSDGHPDKPRLFSQLGVSYDYRFRYTDECEDLNKAMEYKTLAVQLTPDGHPNKPDRLNNLGVSYESRFQHSGKLEDLNKTIEYQAQAVLLTPDGHADKPSWLNNLGISYQSRFRRTGELEDLDMAIQHHTQAVPLTPDGHADKPSRLSNLGISYQLRFTRIGELADMNKAVDYHTQALLLTPDGHPDRPRLFSNLGSSYDYRFRRIGELADLNKAIEYQTQAVLLTPDGHADKPSWLGNLGNSYLIRFGRISELEDLNKAIQYQSQAVQLTPDTHSDKNNRLSNLGVSYKSRFSRIGEPDDMHKAIEYQSRAVSLTPDGHPDKPSLFNNLGNSYESRFSRLRELADLNKAIEYQNQAVLLAPDGHANKPTWLNDLGTSYLSRFGCIGELVDLSEAIQHQSQAVLLTPDGHAHKPTLLHNLGTSYHSRFKSIGEHTDLKFACSHFQNASQLMLVHPEMQLKSAREWAKCSTVLGVSPKVAYERCMELVPYFIWLGTSIDQRYSLLSELSNLATEAAAWAISVDAYELALQWLEEGRSIVWNQVLQLRTPFDDICFVDPVLAHQLKDTAVKLEIAASRPAVATMSMNAAWDLERNAQNHHHLATTWESLLRKAREIPGLQNFLRPRNADELKLAASDGPVVVLNAHCTRCDALIIFPECDDIVHLPLSRFSMAKLGITGVRPETLVELRGQREGGFKRLKPAQKLGDTFKHLLATLWSDLVQPVLDILACSRDVPVDEIPHVTWCATGALSFLPLHAAGYYDGSQSNAFDLVVSSYTPTLGALLTPRTPIPGPDIGLLAVGQANTQGLCPLPYTVQELTAIREHTRDVRFHQLEGENGTVDAVLDALDKHSWVHLACHATQDPINPTHSAFHLHDGSLTLEEITKRSFKNKGLAFLSACQTATGDNRLQDEAVHLAAGMLMAGYPSVIATMWPIFDEDAPTVAGGVYAELLKNGRMNHLGAARALHKAIAGLRATIGNDEFHRWVPFIHIGA